MSLTSNIVLCVLVGVSLTLAAEDTVGSRKPVDVAEAERGLKKVDEDIGSGKLYFTGTGYTVNLIPHALVLGLLTFALIFLYGDSLFGTSDTGVSTGYGAPAATGYAAPSPSYSAPAPSYSAPAPSYSAPSTGYNAASRYYDPYAANAASALGGDAYSQDPYAAAQDPATEG